MYARIGIFNTVIVDKFSVDRNTMNKRLFIDR